MRSTCQRRFGEQLVREDGMETSERRDDAVLSAPGVVRVEERRRSWHVA